jgi:glycosyltransferase involved in cell wall biosynthesis
MNRPAALGLPKKSNALARSPELAVRIAFFTGYIPPYMLPVYQKIKERVADLAILISTRMEGNRRWKVDFGGLNVIVQRAWTLPGKWKHEAGFSDRTETHIPRDTLRQIRSLRPDVIVSEELGIRSLLCALCCLLFFRKTPLLLVCNLSEHTEQGRGPLRRFLRKWLRRRASLATVNGLSGRRYLQSIGFEPGRLGYFPYVASPGIFDQIPLHRADEIAHDLVYVGELTERKGLTPFVEQAAKWCTANPERAIRLRLVGTGPLQSSLMDWKLPPNFQLETLGYMESKQVAEVMANSGILVFPTLADEWGLVVNEALSAGLPVLGSRLSQAVEELIRDGENGWTFDTTQANSVYLALEEALNCDVEDITSMREHCRASVAARTPEWAAEHFLRAVRQTLEVHRG